MTGDERAAALSANIAAYGSVDEKTYVNGAPHLKHRSIARVYGDLVDEAIRRIGRDPKTISVLELGAGNGLGSIPWFERKVRMTAVDSSESMLSGLTRRAANYGLQPRTVAADALDFLNVSAEKFDVITHVSMIHHVPDYRHLLSQAIPRVAAGGCLITFQDPLRYDQMPFGHHFAERASYFAWRVAQGNVRRGLKTRWRRLRGVYSPAEVVDFEDYHVVREGVDSADIARLLQPSFADVKIVSYWSTYSRFLQGLGQHLRLASSFGVLAAGRRPS
ncbi:MAG: class I SAM-dependent methyltransferase [Candidatus Dormibacteraceae bacterium]